MAIVIESPKLLPIRVTQLKPNGTKNNFVYTYNATLDVTAQLHSGTTGHTTSQYDGKDIRVGDYVATTGSGKILKVSAITNAGPTKVECILLDEDQLNSAIDNTQYGESSIDADDGILFELREGKPCLFPLPDILPGGLTDEFAIQIISRFNFVSKDKNINVEQLPHNFTVGETVKITDGGWVSDTTMPTGVVVKADDDSFSVRLFGTKTHLELPGNIGDVYFWDPIDRILTKTPTASNSVKLFQKLDSREALLIDVESPSGGYATVDYVDQQLASVISGGSINLSGYVTDIELQSALASASTFSGDYNDLVNKPSDLVTTTQLANQLASYQPTVDLTAYALKTEIFTGNYNDLINKPTLFTGNYNDLYNQPAIPTSLSELTNDVNYITNITSQMVSTALGYTPQNAATAFTGDYNSLINTPVIPTVPADVSAFSNDAGYITSTEVDNKITSAVTGGTVDLSEYVTDSELQSALSNYQPTINLTAYALKADVFSGNYNDLNNAPTIPDVTGFLTEAEIDAKIANIQTGGAVDLAGYATETYVQQQISSATLGVISNLTDLNDVAIDGTETTNHVLMYNPLTTMWENTDLDETFATREYVTQQLAQVVSNGQLDLSGYATESFVTQKLLERGDHFSGNYNDLVNRPQLFNGNYNSLTNKPVLKNYTITSQGTLLNLVETSADPDIVVATVDLQALGVGFSGDYNDLSNAPILFSGNYNDLANKPYIPSIAGLATEQYVNDKHAEPTIWGDKSFEGDVVFKQTTNIKASTADTTAEHKNLVMAIQTTDSIETEVVFTDGSKVEIADNSTVMFEAHIVGASSIGQFGTRIKGIVHRTSSGLVMIGDTSREILAEYGTWTANVSVENTNLKITVVGSDATTVDWTVFCEVNSVAR